MKKFLSPVFVKVLATAVILQIAGLIIAHVPLIISRSSDPDCIANLMACKRGMDKVFVTIGLWPGLISYVVFVIGLLLIPAYVVGRFRHHK